MPIDRDVRARSRDRALLAKERFCTILSVFVWYRQPPRRRHTITKMHAAHYLHRHSVIAAEEEYYSCNGFLIGWQRSLQAIGLIMCASP